MINYVNSGGVTKTELTLRKRFNETSQTQVQAKGQKTGENERGGQVWRLILKISANKITCVSGQGDRKQHCFIIFTPSSPRNLLLFTFPSCCSIFKEGIRDRDIFYLPFSMHYWLGRNSG